MEPRKVSYVHSKALLAAADRLPSNLGRASLVHSLIDALELLQSDDEIDAEGIERRSGNRARVIESVPATREDLLKFHEKKFVGESHLCLKCCFEI